MKIGVASENENNLFWLLCKLNVPVADTIFICLEFTVSRHHATLRYSRDPLTSKGRVTR